jgi:hypothetical protein
MTPQEKAQQLLHEYRILFMNEGEDYGEEILVSVLSKQCTLIAIDEILHSLEYNTWQNREILKYYEEVKQEIEKL